jgi:hypothetical protein
MKKLLLQDTFDTFRTTEVTITTVVTHSIDGIIHPEFYHMDEVTDQEHTTLPETYIGWKDIKPTCYSIIKGKNTPLSFKIVFLLTKENTKKLLEMNNIAIAPEDVTGLYLNCQYEKNSLLCVTGTSLRFFTLDKSLDQIWDEMVIKFLKQQDISFQEV